MIDIESDVFTIIRDSLREQYGGEDGKGIFISGEYIDVPATFPAVTIIEASNTVYERMRTKKIENAVRVLYEVNVYTNRIGYKKSDAKKIMETIDADFERLGFTRKMYYPVSNLQDATIYRLFARYEAIVDEDMWIYTS